VRRFAPSLLAIWAVLCLLIPPAPIVHAHEDGHDAHAHGLVHTFHAPLCAHVGHDHRHGTPDDDGREPSEDEAPEHHVHSGDPIGALARSRLGGFALDGARGDGNGGPSPFVPASAFLSVWTADLAERAAPRGAPRLRPPSPRSVDKLVELGRLLI
jgi:hypothetical protein